MAVNRIPLFRPRCTDEHLEALARVMRSGWWGQGPETALLESEFAAMLGVDPAHCVAVNSCTAAMELALGLSRAKSAATPAVTFCAAMNVLWRSMRRAELIDVCEFTGQMMMGPAVASDADAIMPVHFGGRPMSPVCLKDLAAFGGPTIIEDCAHACGATVDGKAIGTTGHFGCWSFHAVKNCPAGDGGMLYCLHRDHATRARALAWHGIDRSTHARAAGAYSWDYGIVAVGMKCHMNDITAAIARVSLRNLAADNARRATVANAYSDAFRPLGIAPPKLPAGHVSAWHLYQIDVSNRDETMQALAAAGIATGCHYRPMHHYPVYGMTERYMPGADMFFARHVSLPMFPEITDAEIERVIRAVVAIARR